MRRVTGIGGVFLTARDPAAMQEWYRRHLGIDVAEWGGTAFRWVDADGAPTAGTTVWSVADAGTAEQPVTINYRVADLRGLLAALREEGCRVLNDTAESEFGSFGWVIDPEGNKIELWQPPVGQ